MEAERTFMLLSDHPRKFEYRARTHVFSLPQKDEENTSDNADPTTSNPPKNRGSSDVIRHFPGLGILTKMPHAAFSSPICG
jgi:hypothetical protein